MNIKILNNYKSLNPSVLIDSDLPDFVILTGENGSGKTHLLNGIYEGVISVDGKVIDKKDIIKENFITIQSKIAANSSGSISANAVSIYNALMQKTPISSSIMIYIANEQKSLKSLVDKVRSEYENPTKEQIKNWIYEKIFKLKPFQGDFLADIFRDYKILMINNYINKMQCREFLSEEKFEKKYGEKPWNVINGILNNKILLNFVFEEPEIMDFTSQYQVVCKNTIGDKFFVSDISSGEKVLLSIIINIFSAIKKRIEPVKLILLDELDASLHPSMIQNLLNLLEKIFVKEYNIKVVLTTHSPTTVALADNKYLYYITSDSDNVKRIIKKDKDFILKKLAYGITTLSVSYINRKNIITESEYDAENLSKIYEILLASKDIESHISLNFIPSGVNGTDVSGDCNRVCKIVGKFDNYANVYGVIDWDLKNNTKDKIFVLAENERYSIENCILDPLMIVCMLLLDNKAPIDPSEFGLSKYFALPKDKNFEENIQKVIDSFINKISKQIKFKDINIKTTVGYIGGLKVEIPTEYLHFKGHRLEELLKQEFNQLKQYRNPNDLKKVIINMLKQYPEFIPNCFKELFLKIIK